MLDGFLARFVSSNADRFFDRVDEDFTVADFAGLRRISSEPPRCEDRSPVSMIIPLERKDLNIPIRNSTRDVVGLRQMRSITIAGDVKSDLPSYRR